MAAQAASALAKAHQVALQRGDKESAKHFAESAARLAMYYASGNPILPMVPTDVKPKKRRKKRQGSPHAAFRDHQATIKARRENALLAGFVGVAAVLGLLVLFIAMHDHMLPHGNESLTPTGPKSPGH